MPAHRPIPRPEAQPHLPKITFRFPKLDLSDDRELEERDLFEALIAPARARTRGSVPDAFPSPGAGRADGLLIRALFGLTPALNPAVNLVPIKTPVAVYPETRNSMMAQEPITPDFHFPSGLPTC